MTREQAINSMISHGFTVEQVGEIIKAVTDKNDLGVDCIVDVLGSYTDLDIPYKREIAENILTKLPSVTPQLSVPEVTALAEWTTKLTEASEGAYNKGYADGVKSVNICPHCGEYIGEEE